jgi:hypothetical protein
MSYLASLIERLKAGGSWEQMPAEDRAGFQGLSEDDARRLLVLYDELDMADPELARRMQEEATDALFGAFRQKLLAIEGERVLFTPIGELLASVVAELQAAGVDCTMIGAGFGKARVSLFDELRNGDIKSAAGVFMGKLVEYDDQRRLRTSPIGEKLNRFVRALQAEGIPDAEIEAGFDLLNPIVLEYFVAGCGRWTR